MIEIYLCDDEDAVRDQIRTALEWKIFVENYDMRVAYSCLLYTSPSPRDM